MSETTGKPHSENGVKVAVDNAAFKFDMLYDYRVPAEFSQSAVAGARVVVPFGKGNAARMGIILDVSPVAPDCKQILYAEPEPVLDSEFVGLIHTLKDYTFCTYFDAVKTVLPKFSRAKPVAAGGKYSLEDVSDGFVETVYSVSDSAEFDSATARQKEILGAVARPMTFNEITEASGAARSTVNRLVESGLLVRSERVKALDNYKNYELTQIPPLTEKQSAAAADIADYAAKNPDGQLLLHGVTSSGKTLVYINIVERYIKRGKGALILVPEIAIASQMIYRLKSMFGERVGIIHSALSDSERQIQWLKIKSGEQDIVVGTRSAVFAPLKNLGVIIVDEEQEQTYSSEQSPRYNAVAIARVRAKQRGAFLLLASATPSVETYHKAVNGQIGLVELNERYLDLPLPKVKLVDMQAELSAGNTASISRYLKDCIDLRLEKGEQSILLLNRRGYRTVTVCSECRKVLKCRNCDVPMVLHKQSGCMICHYCGSSIPVADRCEDCGGTLRYTGIGTQRIEEELEELFPSARILRLDTDSTARKYSVEEYLRRFGEGSYDILVGTQMIAKGLDFPNVTLVGVQSVDSLLLMSSYRAYERTFSMLAQVIGRSGRSKGGEAVIQTVEPQNPIMKFAQSQDYGAFYRDEIAMRKLNLYPPFCAMCTVGFLADTDADALAAANEFVECLKQASSDSVPLRVLGPTPFRVAVVNRKYRYKVTIKCRGDWAFRELLRGACSVYIKSRISDRARFYVDFVSDNDN